MSISTKELDTNLLEAEFYEKPFYFSYSSLNKLITAPAIFYKEYVRREREDEFKKYLLEGIIIHYLVLEHQGFDDKFLVTSDNLWANVYDSINLSKIVEAMKGLFKNEQVVESQSEILDTLDFNLSFVPVTFFLHYWYLKSIYTHPNPEPNIAILTTSIALMSLLMTKNDDYRMTELSVDNMANFLYIIYSLLSY
jgi:hypothetical protein